MCSPSRRTPHSSASAAGFCSVSNPLSPNRLDEVGPEELLLAVARELEDSAPTREDSPVLVADHEPVLGAG